MLPFLKNKDKYGPGLMVKTRAPDQKPQDEQEDNHSMAIEACAHELIAAIHAKDVKSVAEALKDAFEILDSMPHEEGEHTEPHSYDAQNIKAAEGKE